MHETAAIQSGSRFRPEDGPPLPNRPKKGTALLEKETAVPALKQALAMLRPDLQWNNPVMFAVEIGAFLTLLYIVQMALGGSPSPVPITYFIALDAWLFLTVFFANFATALAEARGKARADSLRRSRQDTVAYRRNALGALEQVASSKLDLGDIVVVEAGQMIPADGEILEGVAAVNEAAITGESAPVIREAGGDRSGVTGGTLVLSDRIVVRVSCGPGQSFLDRMIALVEGAIRQRTPNEIALTLVLSALTLVFLVVVVPLWPMAWNAEQYMTGFLGLGSPLKSLGTDVPTLIALFVCLIPTTIGALLAAIGIAGMDRAMQANILAKSGKAVELCGDIDMILLDKTGTITVGDRHATRFVPAAGLTAAELGRMAALASASDGTPEGRSILRLQAEAGAAPVQVPEGAVPVPFSAQTRMSGVDLPDGRRIRKGASDAVLDFARALGGAAGPEVRDAVAAAAAQGATPLVVADGARVLGVIVLEDVLKPQMAERFYRLRRMGLRTVMITGDNPVTASVIAARAGVDHFISQATPETKLAYIREQQAAGHLVAMTGDGTNDAPALAQADVALAMNAGTQAAKEAANLVDLDSDPTKLIETIEIGKQLLMTRGSLMTFSIANDVAKYFAIIPALFAGALPWLGPVNVMRLHSPTSAILSAVIFNALIIPALIPIALRGVAYRPLGADALLRRNLLIWGLGGVVLPFLGIKLIDLILVAANLTL